jgi:hypothetical protein
MTTLEEGKAPMPIRSLVAAALLALLLCGAADAAPVTVQLRVEGTNTTLFEGPVTTDGHAIDKGDGPHPCDGTTRTTPPLNSGPGPTMISALDDASRQAGFSWSAQWFSFGDFLVSQIGPDAGTDTVFWGTVLNYQPTQVGGCQQQVAEGDEALFALGDIFSEALLRLDGPARARTGVPFDVSVTNGQTGATVQGATVAGVLTGPAGQATLTSATTGVVRLKAEAPGAVRSNAVNVCVSETGAGDCGVPPAQLGGAGAGVKDSVAPRVRIRRPREGRRYRRGPRLLSGTASDNVGVAQVMLALRRHDRGKPCRSWSSSTERFVGRSCARKFFDVGSSTRWSYQLPGRLGPGRYVLDVEAFDRARNLDGRIVRGTNRVVFYVGRRYARARGSARPRGARVPVLLAGKSASARAVIRAGATLVEVGEQKCKVGASTPLAALARLLRRERLGYRIRDYGSCSRKTAAGSGQLFLRKVGKDANRGNDGWFYKVNDRAPEVGAADPASRLHSGVRLLWFYCLFDEAARSCQRSLRIVPLSGSAAGGIRVRVRGYDNAGHWKPVAGVRVAAGAVAALSGADGVATLAAGEGRHTVTARKEGLVDAFPLTVNLR